MSKKEFLKTNRKEIDAHIRGVLNDPDFSLNDDERWEWVMNDEGLYNWARSEGVNV